MSMPIQELIDRKIVHDVTDPALLGAIPAGTRFYWGIDPTAPALHLGNLVPFMLLVRLARAGLRPVILFGGATAAIGDPSGRSAERPLLDRSAIDANIAQMSVQVRTMLDRCGLTDVEFVNNATWTDSLSAIDLLRDIGKHLTVNYMLGKDSVKSRLGGEGLSFTEFSYMVLQAFDFWHLSATSEVQLQIGGADQWGNITSGLELIRKKSPGTHAHAMTVPLLLDAQGRKFGKSTGGGSLWLDPALASPFKIHQHLLNTSDEDAIRYLDIFCLWESDRLAAILETHRASPEQRAAQNALADEIVRIVNGSDAVAEARRSASVLFGGSLAGISESALREIFSDAPSSTLSRDQLAAMTVVDLFVTTGLAPSKSEARRLIQSGGAYVQNERIEESAAVPFAGGEVPNFVVLRAGKKRYCVVEVAR